MDVDVEQPLKFEFQAQIYPTGYNTVSQATAA